MKNLTLKAKRFLASEDGPTAVEYAVMLALIGASLWRLEQGGEPAEVRATVTAETAAGTAPLTAPAEPRLVRADSWLAVAVLEDHIASLDDALNYARISGGPAEVARLERTRAELFASYSQLRYAERVSANF